MKRNKIMRYKITKQGRLKADRRNGTLCMNTDVERLEKIIKERQALYKKVTQEYDDLVKSKDSLAEMNSELTKQASRNRTIMEQLVAIVEDQSLKVVKDAKRQLRPGLWKRLKGWFGK